MFDMHRVLCLCFVALILSIGLIALTSMSRKRAIVRSGGDSAADIVPRTTASSSSSVSDLYRGLVPHSTRTGVATILSQLHEQGLLSCAESGVSASNIRRKLRVAMEAHSKVATPYGTVVKRLKLGDGLLEWDYCCPMAVLHHISSLSKPFYDVMVASCMHGRPMRIILYVDGCEPGNPLRPESEREVQCMYWTFADLPAWLLCRTGSWFVFGFLRDCIVNQLPGKLSDLIRRVLHIFFPLAGQSFSRGIIITAPDGESSHVVTAMLAGILADESAHKYVGDMKGASGTKPCNSCSNIVSLNGPVDPPLQKLDCTKRELFIMHSNASVYAMADDIEAKHGNIPPKTFERLQQHYGLNYNPHGLLQDKCLRARGIYKPIDHTLRDWMHTLVSGGVANVHMGLLLHVLVASGITLESIGDHVMKYTLPKKHGKVQRTWITENRLKDDNLSSFASTMLSLVPILLCFLNECVAPHLPNHILCFKLLNDIIDIMRLGADRAVAFVDRLSTLIELHASLFTVLYPDAAKPKFHHLFHIIDHIRWLGKLLSCFVTERKHRATKKAALHVFRYMEHTVLADMVNSMVESMRAENGALWTETALLGCNQYQIQGEDLRTSNGALLACGEVKKADIVWLTGGIVCRVVSFWELKGHMFVQTEKLDPVSDGGSTYYTENSHINHFAESNSVIDACIWIRKREGLLKVIKPFAATL